MFEDFQPLEFETFRGLFTWPEGGDVPPGYSPDLLNVRFKPGSVFTRPALGAVANMNLAGPNRFNGLTQFIDNLGVKTLVALDSNGELRKHDGANWNTVLGYDTAQSGSMMKSAQLFNRIFLSFYRGALVEPDGPVRDFDGTNLDVLAPSGPGAGPGAADAATGGSIGAGAHKVAVIFEVRNGRYLTEPSPEVSWTAAGAKKVSLTNIPTGPSWVTARRVIFTAAGGSDWFYLNSFRIGDNSTTSIELDFTDTALQLGENYNKYFRNLRVPDFAGITSYGSRLIGWGGINTVKLINLEIDGGFDSSGVPLGWTGLAGFAAAGSKGTVNPFAGEYYIITGDGATASPRGEIGNADAAAKLQAGVRYTVSARVRQSVPSAGAHRLVIDLVGTGVDTTGLVVNSGAPGATDWIAYEAELTDGAGLASIPADLKLRVFVENGTMPAGETFEVDHIYIYPKDTKYEASTVRVSDPGDVRFDGLNGLAQISKDDGQRLVACIEQNGFLYTQKERSAHVLRDDGQNTPNNWPQQRISSSVGGASPNAVDGVTADGQDYYITASRAGAFRVHGQSMTKLTQEIQTTWARINWNVSHTIHTVIDPENKLAYIFAPLDGATEPDHCFLLDFTEGWGSDSDPGGRKWGLDQYPRAQGGGPLVVVRSSARIETSTRRFDIYLGSTDLAANTAQVWNFSGTADGGTAAINSYYDTAFRKARDDQGGQDLFGGASVSASGFGTLAVTLYGFDGQSSALAAQTLATQIRDYEMIAGLENDRAKIRFAVNSANHRFNITRAILWATMWATSRPL